MQPSTPIKPIAEPQSTVDKSTPIEVENKVVPAPEESNKQETPTETVSPAVKATEIPSEKRKIAKRGISSDISKLVADIKKTSEHENQNIQKWELPIIQKIWSEYGMAKDSKSIQLAFEIAKLELKDESTIAIILPNKINEETIKAEVNLMEKIRKYYPDREVLFEYIVDLDKFPEYEKQEEKKTFTPTDKLRLLTQKNPVLQDLIDKFDLKIDK